jgi:hypothetical protein
MNLAASAYDFWLDEADDDGIKEAGLFTWPSCADHFKYTNVNVYATQRWYRWEFKIGDKPHGPVHAWIGGVGGQCEDGAWDEMKDDGMITEWQLQNMKHNSFIILKNLWRNELIKTPKYCSEDAPVSECMWKCVDNFEDHPKLHYMTLNDCHIAPNQTCV